MISIYYDHVCVMKVITQEKHVCPTKKVVCLDLQASRIDLMTDQKFLLFRTNMFG